MRSGRQGRRGAARSVLVALLLLAPALSDARAAMVERPIEWRIGDTSFDGRVIYDDAATGRRPGLLMVPNWYGVNREAIDKARMIASRRGAVVLLADLYGRGVRPRDAAAARAASAPLLAHRDVLAARMERALAELRRLAATAPIDVARLAAIGFCFGGAAVLELARDGTTIAAVVSFHGELSTDDPSRASRIRARVLAINGADDPLTAPDFAPFLDGMRLDPSPWQFSVIGHAVHCFTETGATATIGPCRYDASAAARAYTMMDRWLDDSFEPAAPQRR